MEQLYAEHFTPLVDWCARRVGDRQLAEDAVQEASIQLWRRVASGDTQILDSGTSAVRRNVLWAASKLVARARALESREQRTVATGLDEDPVWVTRERRQLVEAVCARLPRTQRLVLHLRYVEGLSDAEAAGKVGMTVKAYRRRLDRALDAARAAFAATAPT
jgi:RNA polymerase sigma-70 factor (ECF subfamily)